MNKKNIIQFFVSFVLLSGTIWADLDDGLVGYWSGLPPFLVPVVMRVFHTYSPCLE